MTRKLMMAGLALAVLAGCKDDEVDNPLPDAEAAGCLVETETMNGNPHRDYQYLEGSGQLYRVVEYQTQPPNKARKRYTFEYDPDGRVAALRETNLTAPFGNVQYDLHYSGPRLDTIRKYQLVNSGPNLVDTYALEYNLTGQISKYKWRDNYIRYEYDAEGNLARTLVLLPHISGEEAVVAEFGDYDGKQNVYADTRPAQLINLVKGEGVSPQNPGSFRYYGASSYGNQTGVINYRYDQKEKPTEASIALSKGDGTAVTQVQAFSYRCD